MPYSGGPEKVIQVNQAVLKEQNLTEDEFASRVDRLNRLFGEATPLRDQASFVNHVVAIAKENNVVVAQVENNTREQALNGNLPGAVQQAVVRVLSSHQTLATLVLKSDKQAMSGLIEMIYDLVRDHQTLNLDHLNPQHPTHPTS